MLTAAAISGTYADLRFIKTRGVAVISIEVPIEAAHAVLELLGAPRQDRPVWVAIARLKKEPTRDEVMSNDSTAYHFETRTTEDKFVSATASAAVKAMVDDGKRAVQRAGILSNDPAFIVWGGWQGYPHSGHLVAAQFIRTRCQVESRADLATNAQARKRFWEMVADYEQATGRIPQQHG